MKKAIQTSKCSYMPKALLLLVCLMTALVASAKVEWKTFEPGVKYQYPSFVDEHYKFTPTEDGVLRIYRNGSGSISVSTEGNDENGTVLGRQDGDDWISYCIQSWKYKGSNDEDGTHWIGYQEASLKAGKTYYIMVPGSFDNDGEYFKGVYETNVNELKLVESNFEIGKLYDITDTRHGQLELTFNMNADADSATVEVGRKVNCKVETRTSTNSGKLILVLKDSINQWLDRGWIYGGEEMTITIPNVRAASDSNIKYGTDGTLVLTFITPSKPHTIVSKQLPDPFLSYWLKGDEKGIAVLTFDADVMQGEEQTVNGSLLVGYAELDDVYNEALDPSCFRAEGNKLYIDFTGKLRTKEAMGLSSSYSTIRFSIKNIKMADGSNVYSQGAGTSGSFTFNMPFQEYKSNIAYEFTPADGEQLTDDNVKLYFSEKNTITFGGVRFTYQDMNDNKYQTIVTEGITSVEEGDEGIEYTIPITAEIKAGKNVRFALEDVVANDGMDHGDITAKWNPGPELLSDLAPAKVSVKDGSVVKSFEDMVLTFEQDVTVNAGINETAATFTDTETGKIVAAYVETAADNNKQVVVTPAEELKNNHKYQLDIKEAVVVDAQYVETNGKYGNYMTAQTYNFTIYANFGGLDFMTSPIEGSTVNEISQVVVTMLPGKDDSLWGIINAHNDTKHVYLLNSNKEKVATATLTDLEGGFAMNFEPAVTEPGVYTVHMEDSVYFLGLDPYQAVQNEEPVEFQYTVVAAPTELSFTTSPADESVIPALDQIVLKSEENMYGSETPVYAYANRKAYNGVLTINPRNRKEAYITFDNGEGMPITDEATYRVEIPEGVIGDKTWYDNDGLTGKCNAYTMLYYTVGKAAEDFKVTADPVDGSKVEALSEITLTFNLDDVAVGNGMITVKKDGEQVARIDAEAVWASDDAWTTNVYKLTYSATEDGVYTFEVPEGYFLNGEGDGQPSFTLTYYVGNAEQPEQKPFTVDPADGSELDALENVTIVFNCESIMVGNGMIQINKDGEKFNRVDAEIVYTDPSNWDEVSHTASIAVNATDKGVYTLDIPTGYFINENGDDIEGFTLTYYVGVPSGINNISANGSAANIYTINGVKVSKAVKGLNIINGKKVIKK